MPSANVQVPLPLTRLNPWFPGQVGGVPGASTETGLRQHCTGTVFYVDPNYVGVSDQRDGTDPNDPLRTVAAALTHCSPYHGDVIYVMANGAWQYANPLSGYNTVVNENVIVTVPGVSIVGVFPSGMPGVPWTSATLAGTCITVLATDVLIEGFAFIGQLNGGRGIYAEWDSPNSFADNITVRNCSFDENMGIGIELEFVYWADIHDNFFQECVDVGIYADPAGSPMRNCHIHHNRFTNVGAASIGAISVAEADYCEIDHNDIYNVAAQAGAAATNEGINTSAGGHNLVHHNTLSCILPVAAPGDYADLNSAAGTDSWNENYCMNGPSTTNP